MAYHWAIKNNSLLEALIEGSDMLSDSKMDAAVLRLSLGSIRDHAIERLSGVKWLQNKADLQCD
jgi:hypothetical protein